MCEALLRTGSLLGDGIGSQRREDRSCISAYSRKTLKGGVRTRDEAKKKNYSSNNIVALRFLDLLCFDKRAIGTAGT